LNSFRYRVPIFLFIIALLQCAWLSNLWAEDTNFEPNQNDKIGGWPTEFDGRYPVGTPPGDGWSFVSGDGQKFSSACIGNLRSPQCLVDTMMACAAWSDLDAGWPTETDAEEMKNHPICKSLMNHPIHPGLGLSIFGDVGFEPSNSMTYYKLDSRTVDQAMLESEGAPRKLIQTNDCDICLGDTAIIPVIIRCFPNPVLAGEERTERVFETFDYPSASPITYCVDQTTELEALFTRPHPTRDEWYVGYLFNSGKLGSGGKSWPLIKQWIARFHEHSLPGICAPGLMGLGNCQSGPSPH
jgi:hypothetical protein